jgi:hypothetical protein
LVLRRGAIRVAGVLEVERDLDGLIAAFGRERALDGLAISIRVLQVQGVLGGRLWGQIQGRPLLLSDAPRGDSSGLRPPGARDHRRLSNESCLVPAVKQQPHHVGGVYAVRGGQVAQPLAFLNGECHVQMNGPLGSHRDLL